MKIIKKYNPLTGTYEKYNIITHEFETTGGGLFDTFISAASKVASNVASKLTSDTAKKLGETAAKSAIESATKKAGDELGKYAVERITSRKKLIHDPNLIVKELQSQNDRNLLEESPQKKIKYYRGGKQSFFPINKIFKKI